ncbi:MAG: hypothetical protein ACI8QC_002630, partial [Planctomycetota bacterium]
MTTIHPSMGQLVGLRTLRIFFLALLAFTSSPSLQASRATSHPDEVARIGLLAPHQPSFIVRATLPVPP